MEYRLRRFAVHRTALIVAIIYGLFALIIVPLLYFLSRQGAGQPLPASMVIAGPPLYAAIVYIVTALACLMYNLVAGWLGGVELTLEPRGTELESVARTTI